MPKKTKPTKTEPRLPSREDLVAFIANAPGKVGKREIARAFNIQGGDRIWLKQMLKELEIDGVVDRRRKGVSKTGQLPPVVLADMTGRDRDGELIAIPRGVGRRRARARAEDHRHDAAQAAAGPAGPGCRRPRAPAPRAADRGRQAPLCRPGHQDHRQAEGQVLGIFRANPAGGGRLVPVDKKARGREILIPPGDEGGAQDGDLVAAATSKPGRYGLPHGQVRERLGSLNSEKAVSLIAIHAHGIPHVFPPEVLAEAEAAKPVGLSGREDWRALPLVTIDPADAKDHDDAVHAAPDEDPDNPGGFVVTVAIADVAAYVRPGSALDREALERGNSVYFPDRVVPMLPERISNDLCSLRPREDRPALAVRMIIGADGRKKRHRFHRVMMRSAAKLSYAQAQAAIDGRPDDEHGPAARHGAAAALGGLRGRQEGPARPRAARSRPARAQDPAQARRHGRPGARAGAARRAPADRGVHDPRQCRGRRDAGEGRLAADLPRPRRALAREDAGAWRGAGVDRHQAAQGGGAEAGAVQPHPRERRGHRAPGLHQRGRAALAGARPSTRPRTTAISA